MRTSNGQACHDQQAMVGEQRLSTKKVRLCILPQLCRRLALLLDEVVVSFAEHDSQ